MTYIDPKEWKPSSEVIIDESTLEIIKSNSSKSIDAGPGAGKTELLAQRAAYLLSTGQCVAPHRILAIAFKVDAAQNLRKRVEKRVDDIHSQRFDSHTLDAFAKRIVDQFLEALPPELRPTPDYKILFPNKNTWLEFIQDYSDEIITLRSMNSSQMEKILDEKIPDFQQNNSSVPSELIQKKWWRKQLDMRPSFLTFNMIKLLAIHILNTNEKILSLFRKAYTHVFLDEFQDVTHLQYALIKNAFWGSDSVLTAVGDKNQSIMRWAGADLEIFEKFEKDFNAKSQKMPLNFRSNLRIVNLINDMAATLDDNYVPTECARKDDIVPKNAVESWVFRSRESEADYLASFISKELSQNPNLKQSDFLILARQKVNIVEERIRNPFLDNNLNLRNEAKLVGNIAIQDIVSDKTFVFLISSLKLALNIRTEQPFWECANFISEIRGANLDNENEYSKVIQTMRRLVRDLYTNISNKNPKEVSGIEFVKTILKHITQDEIKRRYREYSGSDRLSEIFSGFAIFFDECRQDSSTWEEVVTNLVGSNSVHLMTIHKSKGLEYHTVIFVEFNDDTFWGNDDDKNVFFVALSRARERVFFTFAKDSKGFTNVSEFIKNLKNSNVPFIQK